MSGCSICGGGVKEGFHGENITLTQRIYMFCGNNKGSICIYTIALMLGLFFIMKKK
jgi:hypothetical protein